MLYITGGEIITTATPQLIIMLKSLRQLKFYDSGKGKIAAMLLRPERWELFPIQGTI